MASPTHEMSFPRHEMGLGVCFDLTSKYANVLTEADVVLTKIN
jgi:hypothetical protein